MPGARPHFQCRIPTRRGMAGHYRPLWGAAGPCGVRPGRPSQARPGQQGGTCGLPAARSRTVLIPRGRPWPHGPDRRFSDPSPTLHAGHRPRGTTLSPQPGELRSSGGRHGGKPTPWSPGTERARHPGRDSGLVIAPLGGPAVLEPHHLPPSPQLVSGLRCTHGTQRS